jgi:hypothetical protein
VTAEIKSAQDSLRQGQLQRAADTIARGLRVEPGNPALQELGHAVVARARQTASDARTRASVDATPATPLFRQAQAREAVAGRRDRSNQYDRVVRLYGEAARLYGEAMRATPTVSAGAQPTSPVEPSKPPATATVAAPPPPSAPPPSAPPPAPPPATQPNAGSSTAGAAAPAPPGGTTAGTGAPATTPAVVAPSVTPPTAKPTPPPPAPPSVAAEEAAIRATLREYAAAYESLDVDAVRRVYPNVNAGALTRSFAGLSAQEVRISGDDKITIDGANAVVTCTVLQSFTPKVGQGRRQNVQSTFRLQKAGGRWLIVARRLNCVCGWIPDSAGRHPSETQNQNA